MQFYSDRKFRNVKKKVPLLFVYRPYIRGKGRKGKRLTMAEVIITRNDVAGNAIDEALGYIQDLDTLIRGRLVAIKPNDTWAKPKDTTAVTQPDSLRAVIRAVKRYEPRELVVSGGSGAGDTADIFRVAGLMDVIEEEEVTFFDHNKPPFREVKLDYGKNAEVSGPQQSVMINPRVLEYETLIALNQLKVHETATVTLALKNIAMSYPAADYYGHPRSRGYHEHHFFQDMHSFIAAMAKRFPISLAITAGHPAMVGTGPIGGYVCETGLVVASRDPVAADAVGARLLGFEVQAVRHLWEAGKLGLGETSFLTMNFPALSLEEAMELFSEAAYGKKIKLAHA
jgi:uncharacterized protein (DUF362 family)